MNTTRLLDTAGWVSPAKVGGGEWADLEPNMATLWEVVPTSREDTTPTGCARQMKAQLDPCALTRCLILGDPKELPRGKAEGESPRMKRRRVLVVGRWAELRQVPGTMWSPCEGLPELPDTAGSRDCSRQGANTLVDKQQCPWPGRQHPDAHPRTSTKCHGQPCPSTLQHLLLEP